MLFEPIGEEGQRRLIESRVTLIGCGALGTVLANTLARAGVGYMRIVDRDFIELNNLQRQVLFNEDDIAANLPKAEAARRKIQRINSEIEVEAVVTDVNHRNIEQLVRRRDLLLDGTDNFETRFLINDLAVKTNRPWVYGGVHRRDRAVDADYPERHAVSALHLRAGPAARDEPDVRHRRRAGPGGQLGRLAPGLGGDEDPDGAIRRR